MSLPSGSSLLFTLGTTGVWQYFDLTGNEYYIDIYSVNSAGSATLIDDIRPSSVGVFYPTALSGSGTGIFYVPSSLGNYSTLYGTNGSSVSTLLVSPYSSSMSSDLDELVSNTFTAVFAEYVTNVESGGVTYDTKIYTTNGTQSGTVLQWDIPNQVIFGTLPYPLVSPGAAAPLSVNSTEPITGIGALDTDTVSPLSVSVTATGGTVSTTAGQGTVNGNGGVAMTLSGSLTQINADLAALEFTAGSHVGTGSISVVATYAGVSSPDVVTPVTITAGATPNLTPDPDGIGVLDSVTGIEWLPLTDTLGYTYSQVVGGDDPLVPQGYVVATDAQILTLYKDAGFSPAAGVDGFVTGSDVSDGGAIFNSFAALFGKTNATDNLTGGLSASPEFQVANGVASGLTNNALYGPSSITFDHSDSVATQTPNDTAISTTDVTNQAEFMYKVSLPTLAGASITLNNGTVTVAIAGGQAVGLDSLVTDFGGLIPSLILQGPGTADITGPAIIADLEVASGTSLVLQGGTITTDPVTIDADGNITGYGTITGSETINGTITAEGGTLDITGPVSGAGTLTFDAGASLILEGTVAATESLIFSASNQTLLLGAKADVLAPISGLALGDAIGLEGQTVTAAVYDTGAHMLAITGSNGSTFDLSFTGTYQQSNFSVANGEVQFTPLCFLPGTQIATPMGEVSVERLAFGDEVMTLSGTARRIVWIGEGCVLVTRGRRNAATPVIVRKGALADNMPHRDLRVTKAHGLYVDDVLIPVEFLVNHRSILWDDHAQEVRLYHIELETHDVLIANGAPAESYRDDGNRWLFRNANSGWGLPPQRPCAPVLTGGPVVDAAWRRVLDRAGQRPGVPLTDDPDLHLVVDGERLDASSHSDVWHIFRLAARPTTVRIFSRSGVPQELGLARDPRSLGVALRQIMARQGLRTRLIEAKDEVLTAGYHGFEESNGIRWTDGDATVPGELFDGFAFPLEIRLRLGGSTSYVDDGTGQIQRVA